MHRSKSFLLPSLFIIIIAIIIILKEFSIALKEFLFLKWY